MLLALLKQQGLFACHAEVYLSLLAPFAVSPYRRTRPHRFVYLQDSLPCRRFTTTVTRHYVGAFRTHRPILVVF